MRGFAYPEPNFSLMYDSGSGHLGVQRHRLGPVRAFTARPCDDQGGVGGEPRPASTA